MTIQIPQIQQRFIDTPDDVRLGACVYEPEDASATVLINSATAAAQRYYRRFALWLAGHGVRAITYDYRGIGLSRPERMRGYDATLSDWATDAATLTRFALESYGDGPVLVLGHSFGGQLVGLVDEIGEADGLLLVAAGLGHWRHYRDHSPLKLWLWWNVWNPIGARIFGYVPGRWSGLGVDMPSNAMREWARWGRHRDYLVGHDEQARSRLWGLEMPIEAWSFSDDTVMPLSTVEDLLSRLPEGGVRHQHVRPELYGARRIGHFGAFKPRFEPTFWTAVLEAVNRMAAPPTTIRQIEAIPWAAPERAHRRALAA